MRVRALLSLLLLLATMFLANCGGGYTCNATFGASTCTPSSGGLGSGGGGTGGTGGGGGGGGTGPTAFAYTIDENGTIDGYVLNTSAATFAAISGYQAPTVTVNGGGLGMVVAQSQFLYAAIGTANSIYGWSIDSTTGALTAVPGSPYVAPFLAFVSLTGFNQLSMITNPAGTLLFIADAGDDEIWVYQIGSGGALTAVAGSPFSTGTVSPTNLAIDGLGLYLYATSGTVLHEGTTSGIAAFSIGSGGSLGTLAPVVGSPFIFPVPMWALQGEPSGTLMIGISGESIAAGATVDDKSLYVYSIQPSGTAPGALAEVTGSPFATTYPPFNIAVQPNSKNGEFVYSFGVNDSALGYDPIEGYSIDTTTGALASIMGSPFSGVTSPLWGQFDQTGDYLFFYSNINSTQLGVIDAAATTGALTESLSPVTLVTPGYWAVTDPQ